MRGGVSFSVEVTITPHLGEKPDDRSSMAEHAGGQELGCVRKEAGAEC